MGWIYILNLKRRFMNVLISGASSGIGAEIGRYLVEKGCKVTLMARRIDKLQALFRELNEIKPDSCLVVQGDVSSGKDCQETVSAALDKFSVLDALVNCAGTWVDENFIDASFEQIQDFIATDVQGAAFISRAVLPHMKSSKRGNLIQVNGLQGFIRQLKPVIYTTVESAVRGFCESLRFEVAAYGVHTTLITLGAVASGLTDPFEIKKLINSQSRSQLCNMEVAEAVYFILSRPKGVNVDELVLTPLNQSLNL